MTGTGTSAQRIDDAEAIKVVPLRRPGRWISATIIALLLALLVNSMVRNPRFEWPVVGRFFTSTAVLAGLGRTIELTVVAMAVGIALGVLVAVMRQSSNPLVTNASRAYIGLFRGTPLLVQLLFWFNFAALYPEISLGIPFGPTFWTGSVNALVTPFAAAILGLGLNEAAYMAEIVRAGILSVNEGEIEAAYALGMRKSTTMRRIVLPQAYRIIIPPTGNEVITTLKNTSLVSVISLPELLYSTQLIYSKNFQVIPLLIVASLWYLIVTTVLTIAQHHLERRLNSDHPKERRSLLHRLGRSLAMIRESPAASGSRRQE